MEVINTNAHQLPAWIAQLVNLFASHFGSPEAYRLGAQCGDDWTALRDEVLDAAWAARHGSPAFHRDVCAIIDRQAKEERAKK